MSTWRFSQRRLIEFDLPKISPIFLNIKNGTGKSRHGTDEACAIFIINSDVLRSCPSETRKVFLGFLSFFRSFLNCLRDS